MTDYDSARSKIINEVDLNKIAYNALVDRRINDLESGNLNAMPLSQFVRMEKILDRKGVVLRAKIGIIANSEGSIICRECREFFPVRTITADFRKCSQHTP